MYPLYRTYQNYQVPSSQRPLELLLENQAQLLKNAQWQTTSILEENPLKIFQNLSNHSFNYCITISITVLPLLYHINDHTMNNSSRIN